MFNKVYTGGTFDLLHAGHVNFLRACSNFGEVIVSLNTDEFVKEFKGKYPIMRYYERETILRELRCVTNVIPNLSGSDSKPTIISVNPNVIIIGDDWEKRNYMDQLSVTEKWLKDHNLKIIYIPYTIGISTTEIKNRIND